MSNRSTKVLGIIAFLSLLVGGCASDGMQGSSSQSGGMGPASAAGTATSSSSGSPSGSPSTSTKNIDRIASGSAEDSLEACMARIPKDASAGQKMVAEQSCRRDHSMGR